MSDNLFRNGRSSSAPKAQFNPIEIGFACLTECQKAFVVCPERVLPEASVMVPEIISGMSIPLSVETLSTANIAAFAFKVSKIVSMKIKSAPPSNKASVDSANVSTN